MNEARIWYAARVILESLHPDENVQEPLFEERLILVEAGSDDEARHKAAKFGEAAREEYQNQYGNTIIWEFREVLDVKPLFEDVIQDGSQVYYSLLGQEELSCLRQALGSAT